MVLIIKIRQIKRRLKMLGWMIVVGILVVAGIVGIIIGNKSYTYGWMGGVGIVAIVIAIFILAISLTLFFCDQQEVAVFANQSQYIASHKSLTAVEDAAITTKKLN
jgi:membrane-bound ClpP family serine protease